METSRWMPPTGRPECSNVLGAAGGFVLDLAQLPYGLSRNSEATYGVNIQRSTSEKSSSAILLLLERTTLVVREMPLISA